ncbi:MAG: serine/threonine-protein kinase [Planctomycetota bacterium]
MDPTDLPAPNPLDRDCLRTRFLEELLTDQEASRVAPVDDYLARYPTIAPFVRSEYSALCQPDGSAAAPDAAVLPETCGRYRLLRLIGSGGMGTVHEATDTELGRRVVLKTLRPGFAASTDARERLRREARVLGRLEHPNLTKVIDLLEADGRMHLVMPFHEGRTLAEAIHEARRRSESPGGTARWPQLGAEPNGKAHALRRIVAFFTRAAEALQSAHAAGIVHRDLKPENLMVGSDGLPVVLDFGLALPEADERLTAAGEILGTPLYMAPEQIEGQKSDARTDVYALGVCLYETLTLVHPVERSTSRAAVFHHILKGEPRPLRRHQPLVPRDLEAVVMRAIERDPPRRYQTMEVLARDLQRVLDLEPTEARPVSGIGVAWRRVRRRPAVSLLAVLVAAVAYLAIWNQLRIDDVKRMSTELATSLERSGGALTDESLQLREAIRRRSPTEEGLHLLYPRGRVATADRFEWLGTDTRDPDMPGIHHRFMFRVEVLDGETVLATWSCPQPDGTRSCRTTPPASLSLAAEHDYTFRVAVESYEVVGESGADAGLLERCRRLTVDHLRDQLPAMAATFRVAAHAPAALRADTGSIEDRFRALLGDGFAADALNLLDGPEGQAAPMSRLRRNELVRDAARVVGDKGLERAAQDAIEREQRR